MIIFLGLGNPGKKYSGTRHNVGFFALDKFKEEKDFPEFKKRKQSLISEKDNIALIKPMTFMNNSGLVLRKEKFDQLIVIHDDLDLKSGEVKISQNRGPGGHKGIESVIKETKTKDFVRIRVGISLEKKPLDPKRFVLKRFGLLERSKIKKTLEKVILIMEDLTKQEAIKLMNKYN